MRDYICINGVFIPKPIEFKAAPLILRAWDSDHASIQPAKPSIPLRDESCFVEDGMHRWHDRAFKANNWERT